MAPSSEPSIDAGPGAGSMRELLQVAVPLILSSGSISLMHVVDRIFLTWYSPDALAAALPAGIMNWTLLALPVGLAAYVNTFVAQYDGAGKRERVSQALWQGIFIALVCGLVITAMAPLGGPLFRGIGHGGEVERLEITYFTTLCLGALPVILVTTLSCFFSGRGKTMVVLWVSLAGTLVNLGLDWCLIFGKGPFPSLGILGAALATIAGQLVSLLLYVILLLRPSVQREYGILAHCRLNRRLMWRYLRFGLPNGLRMLIDIIAFTVFVMLVGKLGRNSLAATNLVFNINTLSFLPMIGLGTAIMTLVGRRIGEGRPELAVRTTWLAFGLSAVYMVCFAAAYLFLPNLLVAPYAAYISDPDEFQQIQELVVVLLRFAAVFAFFDAMLIVFSSAVQGAGDTRFCLVFTFITSLLVMILPTGLVMHFFPGNVIACWWPCTAFIVVMGIGFLLRFRGGRWKSMQVMEPEEDD
jgi:MATE family multidrug resistance protein